MLIRSQWNLSKFPRVPWSNPHWNQWKMLVELLGPILVHVCIKSLLEQMGIASPNASWVNSFKLHHWIPIKNKWAMLLELIWVKSFPSFPFPSHIVPMSDSHTRLIHPERLKNQWNMFLQLPGPISLHFFAIYGTCSKCFLDHFLQSSLLNHHQRSMGNALAIPWVDSFTFRYSIFNRGQWKMLVELPEKILQAWLLNPY